MIEQLEFQDSAAYYARYDYLSSDLLQAADDCSSSLVQLQALQQVTDWLQQLPAKARELVLDMLLQDQRLLQQLLQCWAAEVQQTVCSVQQATGAAAQRYAAVFGDGLTKSDPDGAGPSGAAGGSRAVGGYLAGLCQLLLQLLGACCAQALPNSAEGSAPDAHLDVPQQMGTDGDSSSSAALLQQLAGDLLGGTAVLLLVQWPADGLQERCTLAGLWRSCMWVNLQRCRDSKAGMGSVVRQVQQLCKHVQASLPHE